MPNLLHHNSLKRPIKRALQHLAARYGKHVHSPREARLLVLMYHRILPADDPRAQAEEPGMIVTPETFRLHLQILQEFFDIIPLSHWINGKQTGELKPGNHCAITFDDGWADNYDYAFPLLSAQKIPATIFAVSAMMGTSELFWPERLARLLIAIAHKTPEHWSDSALSWLRDLPVSYRFETQSPDREELSEIIAHVKAIPDREIHQRIDQIEQSLDLKTSHAAPELLSWEQINDMVASGYIEIGSHTCRHTRLNRQISSETMTYEIEKSKQQLEARTGRPVESFCFPNGDYNPEAMERVKACYTGAVTTESGWNGVKSDPYQLKRIGVHEDISMDRISFLARISGWL